MGTAVYRSFIGLEVHIQLLTEAKVFCGCRSAFGEEPNTNICPVCMGYPGALPRLNVEALRMGCTVARALNCRISETTWFDRKQYFYPDMPKNYQITQFASPLGRDGFMDIEGKGASGVSFNKRVRIKECHLEEDSGKMIHSGTVSLLDYNRAGTPLLEIVTEPDMEIGEEAEVFIRRLRRVVRYLGVCDGNMEEGSLRVDANVSINYPGRGLGKKVELKNLNSSRFVRLGLNYEIARQGAALDAGKGLAQETRLWNDKRGETQVMRSKEDANDYRYFPEPDLPVFFLDRDFLLSVEQRSAMELPAEREKRFREVYGLGAEQADLLCEEKEDADYFEAAVAAALRLEHNAVPGDIAARIANFLLTDIRHILSEAGPSPSHPGFALDPGRLASLALMTEQGKVSLKNARQALELAVSENRDPEIIIRERGWELITDPAAIATAVSAVYAAETSIFAEAAACAANPKRRGTLSAYLVGKVLAATNGRADPRIAGKQIAEIIDRL